MGKEAITNGNMIIAEHKDFVKLPNKLDEKQLQLVLLLVAQIKKDDTEFEWVDVSYYDLIQLYNNTNKYSKNSEISIIKMAEDLAEKTYRVFDEGTNKTYIGHYVDRIQYDHSSKIMSIKLSDETKRFFLEDKNRFLITHYGTIKKLHSKCSIQLYRWAVLNAGFKNDVPIKIDDAISLFYDKDKKIAVHHFLQKHLEPAIKKINELTDIKITYEKVYDKKDKRKISSLKFDIIKEHSNIIDYDKDGTVIYDDENEEYNYNSLDDKNYAEWLNNKDTAFMEI